VGDCNHGGGKSPNVNIEDQEIWKTTGREVKKKQKTPLHEGKKKKAVTTEGRRRGLYQTSGTWGQKKPTTEEGF